MLICPDFKKLCCGGAFCVLSKIKANENRKIFIEKIINDLTILHIIFTSQYYKNNRD